MPSSGIDVAKDTQSRAAEELSEHQTELAALPDVRPARGHLLAGEGVLYPLTGSPCRAGGDNPPSMWGKKYE